MRIRMLVLLLLGACGGEPGQSPVPPPAAKASGATPLEHDFGVIPHGETRQHEFPLDLAQLGEPWVPLRVHLDCSCGHADLRLRKRDGSERFVDHTGATSNLPAADEQLVLRVVLDTSDREAVDLPRTRSHGYIVLQHPQDPTGTTRMQWPIVVHFGVEAPVVVRPLATLDFGRVPMSRQGQLLTTLSGDERHPGVTFGPVTCTHPDLQLELAPEGGLWRLRATCRPSQLGNHRALLEIANSLPGYRLRLAATWKVVPDLEATPLPKLSFRAPLSRAQRADEIASQFVMVVDHDERRSPEFAVARIVAEDGRDLSAHFEVTFEPLPAPARQRRMTVRYTGGLSAAVRGSLVLTKDAERGPFLPIELVVFAAKDP